MPTPSNTLAIMEVSQMLAANAVGRGSLFSPEPDPRIAVMLHCEREILQAIYDKDPNYDGIQQVSDYGYALCWKWAAEAQAIVDGGGGTAVAPLTPTQSFPIYITQTNFTTATFYPNTKILGNNIIIYLNEINRYLIPGVEFSVSSTGVTIINTPGGVYLDGFDATIYTYNLVIEKFYT